MTATTVTPDMVRVVFLLRIGISLALSLPFSRLMISEFDGIL